MPVNLLIKKVIIIIVRKPLGKIPHSDSKTIIYSQKTTCAFTLSIYSTMEKDLYGYPI